MRVMVGGGGVRGRGEGTAGAELLRERAHGRKRLSNRGPGMAGTPAPLMRSTTPAKPTFSSGSVRCLLLKSSTQSPKQRCTRLLYMRMLRARVGEAEQARAWGKRPEGGRWQRTVPRCVQPQAFGCERSVAARRARHAPVQRATLLARAAACSVRLRGRAQRRAQRRARTCPVSACAPAAPRTQLYARPTCPPWPPERNSSWR